MAHEPERADHDEWVGGGVKFHTDYPGVYTEPLNAEQVKVAREMLREKGQPLRVILQPGDGTRYEFLLVPDPSVLQMSDDSGKDDGAYPRAPKFEHPWHIPQLYVTELSFGGGTCTVRRGNDLGGIRWRIYEKMSIRNVCTAEALATLVEAVWSDHHQPSADPAGGEG